jgi:hypothetical protein
MQGVKMHTVLFVICLAVAGRLFGQEVIVWDSASKLTWADFRGKADEKSPYVAVTASGIRYRLMIGSQGLTDSVVAEFYPEESWKKGGSESQLMHEQGHFDITEVFARKLRKRIQEYVPKRGSLAKQLNLVYEEVEKERELEEELYDKETSHSTNAGRQAEWNARILRELKELAELE